MAVLTCDRGSHFFEGRTSTNYEGERITVDFYEAFKANGDESIWIIYFKPGEEVICGDCMHQDERFKAKYPWLCK